MLAATDKARPALEELYGRSFDINVGVHSGPVIVGTLWGAQAPLTALGDNVNVASRIEQANKECGTRFLISEAGACRPRRCRRHRAIVHVLPPRQGRRAHVDRGPRQRLIVGL